MRAIEMLPCICLVITAPFACGGDDDAGESAATTGDTEPGTSTGATSSVTTETSPTTVTDTSSSSADTTTESSGSSEGSSSGSESGGLPDACLPEPDDDACAMCTKGMCCDPLVVCFEDPACECFANCYDVMGFMSDEMCRAECTLDANPDAWADVYNCSAMNCLGDCL